MRQSRWFPRGWVGLICAAGLLLGCAGDPAAPSASSSAEEAPIDEGEAKEVDERAEGGTAAEATAAPLSPLVVDEDSPLLLEPAADGPPPLVIGADSPLLLEEAPAGGGEAAAVSYAANEPCFHCHANYREEALVLVHAEEEVGCVDCHGDSFAHRNDENNTTPPDTMYPPQAIDEACRDCHKIHKARPRDVVARWLERCPAKTSPDSIVCTDCHGEHRLAKRSVRWNRLTGELLSAD